MARLGVDFGTSNTGAGVLAGGRPYAIPLETGEQTLPSAVFVDFAERRYLYGTAAARAMMEGAEGRFMRALKSILGTPLAREKRRILNEQLTLIEVIARFLAEIKTRSEAHTGLRFDRALSGRPVHFHSPSPERDAQAATDLAEAYVVAGFDAVDFLPEPEAAALAVDGTGRMLIVDIGGGTSDFTLCDRKDGRTQVLASGGIRLGGTDFDKALSLNHAMPLLGYEAMIGAELGGKTHPAPRALFQDLASWEKIPFVYDAGLQREVERWIRLAREPRLFERLAEVLESHLGHDVAYAVEAGKIAANGKGTAEIALHVVEKGLSATLPAHALTVALQGYADEIATGALETVKQAGCTPAEVDQIVYVGGSSLLSAVRSAMGRSFPDATPVDAEVFTAVVHGLAIAAE
ncbi:Hsp70 family protein [Allosediminivita pacifica]|uniref:Putative chaperone protein n=1 Tax=Allosediminivita pacifica TaxID=1267769 RepID=A0A2T6B5G4_9RHOB|nr:Hsp70 family protein [Allosediminivita pacifica]PTX51331.1 putative chaperone protein [Allosediminivita pacifica]GGA98935.1 molecular chaperone DnaK [Allosediminivita pacifica]